MSSSMNKNYGLVFVSCVALGYALGVSTGARAADEDESKSPSSSASSPAKLSVAPLDHVVYPADRPKWVTDAPKLEGETHHWVVVTPACDSPTEAEEMVNVLAQAAVVSYIEQLTGENTERMNFPIEDSWIEDELIAERYVGELTEGDSPRCEQAVMLSFSPTVQEKIKATWKNFEVRQRLGALGLGVTGLLGMLILGSGVLSVVGRRFQPSQPI